MLSAQFVAWLIAFIIAIVTRIKMREVYFYPGHDEGIGFIPDSDEFQSFIKNKVSYRDAELYFARRYFERSSTPVLKGNWTDADKYQYYLRQLKSLDDLKHFNWNVSLSTSLIGYFAVLKFTSKTLRWFKAIYISFYFSLIIFLSMIIFMLIFNEPSSSQIIMSAA